MSHNVFNVKIGDLHIRIEEAVNEAYLRGYKDGKATREKPCRICKYSNDIYGCSRYKCEWERMKK